MDKEMRKTLGELEAHQGWKIVVGRKHIKAIPPDKSKPIVVISATPSDHRAWQNTLARLRKSGAVL